MEESAKKRGGRRPGAGRKKSTVKRYGFNAPATVHAVLEQVDSITVLSVRLLSSMGKTKVCADITTQEFDACIN